MMNCWTDGSVVGGHWASKKGPKTTPRNYIGWLVRRPAGEYVHHHSFFMGEGEHLTGNTAEHFAVNSLLRWLLKNGHEKEDVVVHLDSQLIAGHLSGSYKVNNSLLAKYTAATRALMARFPSVRFQWIRREFNQVADRLSKALQSKFEGRPLTREEVEELCAAADGRSL
jgi:ribonuclease HI